MLARTESSVLLTTFHLVYLNDFSTGSGAYDWSTRGSSIWPVLFVQLLLTTWCLSQVFSQSYDNISGVTAGLLVRFRLNILKLAQKWQGSSSSFGEIYGYVFVRFMSLCKSVYSRGEPRVFVSSELGSVWHDMARVPVCLSACFCGLNPRTVPHLSLNKFRAPLGATAVWC